MESVAARFHELLPMVYIFILYEGVLNFEEVKGADREADARSGPRFSSFIDPKLDVDVSVFQTV